MPDIIDPSALDMYPPTLGSTVDSANPTFADGPYTAPAPMAPVDPTAIWPNGPYQFPVSQIQPHNTFLSSAVESVAKATPVIVPIGMAAIAAVGAVGAVAAIAGGGAAAGGGGAAGTVAAGGGGTAAASTSTAVATGAAGFTEAVGSVGSVLGTVGTVLSTAGTVAGIGAKLGLFGGSKPQVSTPTQNPVASQPVVPSAINFPTKLPGPIAPSAGKSVSLNLALIGVLGALILVAVMKG